MRIEGAVVYRGIIIIKLFFVIILVIVIAGIVYWVKFRKKGR